MSLRKSPARTPAFIAAHRRNALRSTGPRTRQGKAWSRLNGMKSGLRSRMYRNFMLTVMDAPPGMVWPTVLGLLREIQAPHAVMLDFAQIALETEIELCEQSRKLTAALIELKEAE